VLELERHRVEGLGVRMGAAGSASIASEMGYLRGMLSRDIIVEDPAICGGQPIVRGTRVLVRTLLAYLAAGKAPEEIYADFPSVSPDALRAVIAFAAASARDDLPAPAPIPRVA
jgi:uncharacterized protein (DUF433 family)